MGGVGGDFEVDSIRKADGTLRNSLRGSCRPLVENDYFATKGLTSPQSDDNHLELIVILIVIGLSLTLVLLLTVPLTCSESIRSMRMSISDIVAPVDDLQTIRSCIFDDVEVTIWRLQSASLISDIPKPRLWDSFVVQDFVTVARGAPPPGRFFIIASTCAR